MDVDAATQRKARKHSPFGAVGRIVASRPRLFIGCLIGLIVYAVLSATDLSGPTRAILAWDCGVLVFISLSAIMFARARQDDMSERAALEEEGEWTIFCFTVAGAAFSFIAVVIEFATIKNRSGLNQGLYIALIGATLFLSWLVTHVNFALRYAHEYYEARVDGTGLQKGLEFPGEEWPDYFDFMYFSIVLGMTFQVSDVQITSRQLRRLAAVQGLISFLFNAIIVALTVNLAAGLL